MTTLTGFLFSERARGNTDRQSEEEEIPATGHSVCCRLSRCLFSEDAAFAAGQPGMLALAKVCKIGSHWLISKFMNLQVSGLETHQKFLSLLGNYLDPLLGFEKLVCIYMEKSFAKTTQKLI